jgi:cytochrome c oxidase subunit 4
MTDNEHQPDHGVGHIVPIPILAATGGGLLVLTVVTVLAAGFDFGPANVWIALGIAAVKASLVVLLFMHLLWDRPFNGVVFVASIVFLAIFIGFAMTDTFEYRPDIDTGNAVQVQQKLDAIEQ